ncbi:MAG: DEAD/DEAH box helicase family protein [Candidatus Eisenbacteria sp.]|nr:DEAD/DEAH box helicase family protein [Candidatus Eisenbacteria bacterium]
MDIDFVIKHPDRAYLGTQLWLPKTHINTHAIKASLEFEVFGSNGREYLYLWEDTVHHLAVPREFILRKDYETLTFPIIDMTPKEFPRTVFQSKVVLDKLKSKDDTQKRAYAAFDQADGGLLNLSCGMGKTTLALEKVARTGLNTLVIVNQKTILDQWEKAIQQFLTYDGGIGLIQGGPNKWDWKHPITMATLQTLARNPDAVTPEMRRWFGMIFWDECFVAGTLVDGVPIEKRKVGDLIWSYNEDTGSFQLQTIQKIFVSAPRTLVSIHVGDVEIVCTAWHPFWTTRGWVPAFALTRHSMLLCRAYEQKEGPVPTWERLSRIEILEPTRDKTFGGRCPDGLVYNLQVRGTPTYRVSSKNIVVHNCHHLSAPYFCITAPMFPGKRYGLTATVNREDGTEVVFLYHLGEVFHKNLMQEVQPSIYFRETPFTIPIDDWNDILDKRGNPNISKLRSYVGGMEDRNAYLQKDVMKALEAGRKVLALGHTHVHIDAMYERFKAAGVDVGVCTGKQKVAARWKALRTKQLILGMHDLVKEAIDEDTLDTMVWMTPFGSQHPEGGKNAMQQGMGRIQGYRYHEGMKKPMVLIFDDLYIRHFHRMCNVLRKQFRRWPADEGGPYEFTNLKANAKAVP